MPPAFESSLQVSCRQLLGSSYVSVQGQVPSPRLSPDDPFSPEIITYINIEATQSLRERPRHVSKILDALLLQTGVVSTVIIIIALLRKMP